MGSSEKFWLIFFAMVLGAILVLTGIGVIYSNSKNEQMKALILHGSDPAAVYCAWTGFESPTCTAALMRKQ